MKHQNQNLLLSLHSSKTLKTVEDSKIVKD